MPSIKNPKSHFKRLTETSGKSWGDNDNNDEGCTQNYGSLACKAVVELAFDFQSYMHMFYLDPAQMQLLFTQGCSGHGCDFYS